MTAFAKEVTVFVLHVKRGYEERARHIGHMMERLGIGFEYMLDGDMEDITPERLERYFAGPRLEVSPATSVALKHFLVFEEVISRNLPYALVFEDDIFLTDNFMEVFEKSLEQVHELSPDPGRPFLISYEATCLKLVPRSQRIKGRVIYPGNLLQCMGAYCINNAFAHAAIEKIVENKCDTASDIYVDLLRTHWNLYDLYWSHPVVAEQGSHTGRMVSSIGNPVTGHLAWITIRRRVTMAYKKIVYFFR